jgi:LPS sulfotransferase NodH
MTDFVGALQRVRTTPNGVFGAKLQYSEFHAIRRDADVDLLDLLQPRRIIFLTRRDHLRQAVSWFRAVELGLWNTRRPPDPAPMPPAFDKSAIEALVRQIEVAEAGWKEALNRCGAEVLTATYEELDADYEGVMAACFAFLGEPDTPVPPRGLHRLADNVTEEWVARLRGTSGS